jgi:hypothetical protein
LDLNAGLTAWWWWRRGPSGWGPKTNVVTVNGRLLDLTTAKIDKGEMEDRDISEKTDTIKPDKSVS